MADRPKDSDDDLTQRLQPPSLFRRRRHPGATAVDSETPSGVSREPATSEEADALATAPADRDQPARKDRPSRFRRRRRDATTTGSGPGPTLPDSTPPETVPTVTAPEDPPTLVDRAGGVPVSEPLHEPAPEPTPVTTSEPTTQGGPLFADEVPATQERSEGAVDLDGAEPLSDRRVRRRRTGPVINGYLGSALTGLVVGLVTVLLTAGALRGCESVQGTSSCGRPGLFLLLAILVAMVLLGGLLLRLLRLPDPGSTSFLAVGLLAVIALLFLLDVVYEWWMVIVVPLISMGAYLLSHWVTATLVEPASKLATSRDEQQLWPD